MSWSAVAVLDFHLGVILRVHHVVQMIPRLIISTQNTIVLLLWISL